MAILTGIFILFCLGCLVGGTQLAMHHKETPKKEPEHQAMMQQDYERSKATESSREEIRQGQKDLSQDQELKDPGQMSNLK